MWSFLVSLFFIAVKGFKKGGLPRGHLIRIYNFVRSNYPTISDSDSSYIMVGAVWKQDNRGKGKIINEVINHNLNPFFLIGIYVDHETSASEEDKEDNYVEDESMGNWAELPDLVIERIFSYLSNEKRYYGSLVCRRWYQAFHLPYVWSTFVLEDR